MGKILHILNSISYDGAAILSFRIVMITPQYNHEVISVFKGSAVDEFKRNGIVCSYLLDKKSHGLNFKLKKDLALVRYLLKNKYDIIHFHGGGISALLFAILIKRGAKVIFHLHAGNVSGHPFKKKLSFVHQTLYKLLDPHLNKIATCNHVRKFYIEEIRPVKKDSIFLIQNFTPYNFTSKHKINYRIGYIGRIVNEKGIQKFLELSRSGELRNMNLKFAMIGDIESELEVKIKERSRIGEIEYDSPSINVEKFYEMIDILIFPSELTETLPLVILEAVSFDVAVIALRSKAAEEIFNDYPMLVEKPDSNLYVAKMKEYYSSPIIREQLRQHHKIAANKFNERNFSPAFVSLYESLLSR